MTTSIQDVHKAVKDFDLGTEDSPDYKTGVILLAASVVGPNADRVSSFTQYPRPFVRERFRRWRENGVFRNGKIRCEWDDKENGGMAFVLDVLVGMGLMTRVPMKSE